MDSPLSFAVTPEFLDHLAQRLDSEGVACIQDGVSPDSLKRWQAEVDKLIERQGRRYFSLIQPWQAPDSAYKELVVSADFKALLSGLTTRGNPRKKEEGGIYNVLRVLAGSNGAQKSMLFHYDASVLTALIPLKIPQGTPEEVGDLIAYPNHRPIRRWSFVNAVEKALFQNPWTRARLAARVRNRQNDRNIQRLQPGNIYFFWGYRCLHANLGCSSNGVRATLLFHHGDPHEGSLFTRSIKWLHQARESRNLRAAST